ncbi:tyrosine-type recombinase/integrase [Larkinella sp. GY13]|uniref:tyrosine-type recombinase/integrase n=1 Tax=Larkinella sp. GY13 TaxID=3453720 RepID=UPI003EECE605
MLQIQLRVNGIACRSMYSSGLQVDPTEWDQKQQCQRGRSKLAQANNTRLSDIIGEHKEIMNRMISLGKTPTAESIKNEWLKGIVPRPNLVQLYDRFLQHLADLKGTDQAKAKVTMKSWKRGRVFLQLYIQISKRTEDMEISEVNISWAREYLKWLMKHEEPKVRKEVQNSETAGRYISYIRAILDYAVEDGYCEYNLLDKLVIKGKKPKPVYFLEDHHLKILKELSFDEENDLIRDWAQLACYTGLDYPDLLKFVNDPKAFIVTTPSGKQKIVTDRDKTDLESQIPLLNPVLEILNKYDYQMPIIAADRINRWLRFFRGLIKFKDGTISLKICRKTAGSLFLNEGYSLEVVQKILGHARIDTTQRHYVKILDKRVDREMDRVGVKFT